MTTKMWLGGPRSLQPFSDGRLFSARFSRLHDAGDRLQIREDANLVPGFKKLLNRPGDGSADFQNQPSSGTQSCVSLRKQPRDHLDSRRSGKNSIARLKFPNFQLNLIFLRFADVRRIGDDEVQAG